MIISGYEVLLDDEDYNRLKVNHYNVNTVDVKRRGLYYFLRNVCVGGKHTVTSLHRDVMGCVNGDGKIVDHKDGNTLDNRKENLRFSSHAENMRNSRTRKTNTSGIKGVCWDKKRGKWKSVINVDRKAFVLGYYTDIEDAEAAYVKASKELHGEFSRLS